MSVNASRTGSNGATLTPIGVFRRFMQLLKAVTVMYGSAVRARLSLTRDWSWPQEGAQGDPSAPPSHATLGGQSSLKETVRDSMADTQAPREADDGVACVLRSSVCPALHHGRRAREGLAELMMVERGPASAAGRSLRAGGPCLSSRRPHPRRAAVGEGATTVRAVASA